MLTEEFRGHLQEGAKAQNTISSYVRSVNAYVTWFQETSGMEPHQLYRANILDYISYLRTVKRLSNRSVNTKLAALHCFNEFLVSAGVQGELVLTKKDYQPVQQAYANPSSITKQQVEEFRQRILIKHGKRDYAIVTVLAYAGLRISEALALEAPDINFTAPAILPSVKCRRRYNHWGHHLAKEQLYFKNSAPRVIYLMKVP